MDQFVGMVDLHNPLSLAAMLQQLASDSACRGDQPLYLLTAEAPPRLHNPVNVTV